MHLAAFAVSVSGISVELTVCQLKREKMLIQVATSCSCNRLKTIQVV